jgi:multidrug efflux pump subunit AcrB
VTVFIADIALMLLLLLLLYERFKIALSILTVPLLSVTAVFAGLAITGIELNISTMMGTIMIVGIVTEGAIFYFSEYQALRARDISLDDALVEAGQNRMRPLAMTTIVTILTLLPLAFAIGKGSEMQQPLAVAIICGLLIQIPLTLLIMPTIFKILEKD